MKRRFHLAGLVLMFLALTAGAAQPKRGWTKVEIRAAADQSSAASASRWLAQAGGKVVADYGTFVIAMVPEEDVEAFSRAANERGFQVRSRDELDVLRLPNATVDVRKGRPGDVALNETIAPYARGTRGLYVIQLVAPGRAEWLSTLETIGWKVVRYVPSNGFIAIGKPEWTGETRGLPYVQYLDAFQPYQKYETLGEGTSREIVFILAGDEDTSSTIAAIEAAAEGTITVTSGGADTYVIATMARAKARKLLRDPLIIGATLRAKGSPSAEQQVMSLTSNLNASQTAPASPGNYWNWFTNAVSGDIGVVRCPTCDSMTAADWLIGIADTGLGNGLETGGPSPLSGRKFLGSVLSINSQCPVGEPQCECTPVWNAKCDARAHGTMVAGIAGGETTGQTDGDGYHLGRGVAPRAGIYMTKVSSRGDYDDLRIIEFTTDAVNAANDRVVTIQNHSFNDYDGPTAGYYTAWSRDFDIAVRDGNGSTGIGRPQLFITTSAGNSPTVSNPWVMPGGTAKNVLTLGGVENVRNGPPECDEDRSFKNVMSITRGGTRIAGFIKPDLVAPASAIVSTDSEARDPSIGESLCQENVAGVSGFVSHTGTSFAAPVAAGAAILVKRYLGNDPRDTSPALTKAMLIAGAQSIRGGDDHRTNPPTPVGPMPNTQQGFGRVSLVDLLMGANGPKTYDQSSARYFTQPGQRIMGRFRVRDSSMPVKVVLVWTDQPGTESLSGVNPLVNDLDLDIFPSSSVHYVGNKLHVVNETRGEESIPHAPGDPRDPDDVNNVEVARFFLSVNQEFDWSVTSVSTILGNIDTNNPGNEQDFALVATNVIEVDPPMWTLGTPPQNLTATTSGNTVTLNWSPVSNPTGYVVEYNTAGTWISLPAVAQPPFTHSPGGVALYRVRAQMGSYVSVPSNHAIGAPGVFTEDPPVANTTAIKAAHLVQLRQAANTLRVIGNATAVYAGNDLSEAHVKTLPLEETDFTSLLTAINTARQLSTVALPSISFGSSTPAQGGAIKREHVDTLRNGFRTLP